MNEKNIKIGAILGAISVAIGAFGAHLWKPALVAAGKLDTFETAVKYQFYSSFALVILGLLSHFYNNKFNTFSGYLFIIGTLFFSGSLYLICATGLAWFGAVAPIGGLCLISAWLFMFISIRK